MNSLVTKEGVKIPVIFRPWHEHTGSWFWWGQNLCSAEEYKSLWKMTYDYLQEKGVNHLLYAYSPGSEPDNVNEYVDTMEKSLTILTEVGRLHKKPVAVTETGYEAIPDSTWWTETLFPIVDKYPVSYVLVWRNAREKEAHYYAPYPGQISALDFVEFYKHPKTIFVSDLK